jgi:hypothetical protein
MAVAKYFIQSGSKQMINAPIAVDIDASIVSHQIAH